MAHQHMKGQLNTTNTALFTHQHPQLWKTCYLSKLVHISAGRRTDITLLLTVSTNTHHRLLHRLTS